MKLPKSSTIFRLLSLIAPLGLLLTLVLMRTFTRNVSDSAAPVGWYHVHWDAPIKEGDLVLLRMPMGLVGVVGVGTGIRHGLMHQAEASFATLLGGAGIYNYPTIAPVLSLSSAALVHPATHAVIHAATKLVS